MPRKTQTPIQKLLDDESLDQLAHIAAVYKVDQKRALTIAIRTAYRLNRDIDPVKGVTADLSD